MKDSLSLYNFQVIPSRAFSRNENVVSLSISGSVIIGEEAFWGCNNLQDAFIDSDIYLIDSWAFANCKKLKSIILHDVQHIGDAAFSGIENVIFSEESDYYRHENGLIIGKRDGRLVWASPMIKGEIHIPENVLEISASSFFGCRNLRHLVLPSSVRAIGDWAFLYCKGLSSISIPPSVESIGFDAFEEVNRNFKIICHSQSVAEQYAIDNNLNYQVEVLV